MINVVVVVACLIILVLVGVAGYYLMLLNKQKKAQEKQKREIEALADKKRREHINSVLILSRALLQDEVTLTEASIRIYGLAQILSLNEEGMEKLSVFKQLAEATSHIPILDRWKALSKQDKRRFEKERLSIEDKYRDFVISATKSVLDDPSFLE